MTQEQLAECIGVSFQAVSKWKNNIALPDITLIPKLAQLFQVTTDEIFAYNLMKIEKDIRKIVKESGKYRDSDPEKGRKLLEDGLRMYPDHDILLNNLLYVIDYKKNPDETIRLASHLIDKTTIFEIKYDALRFLAYAYKAKDDMKSAIAAIEQIPEIYFTKLSELATIETGKAKYDAAFEQKRISFGIILEMMQYITEYYQKEGNSKMAHKEAKRAIAFINLFLDDKEFSEQAKETIDFFKKMDPSLF